MLHIFKRCMIGFFAITFFSSHPVQALLYDESTDGDLSKNILPLDYGVNEISGSFSIDDSSIDNDAFAIIVRDGLIVESINYSYSQQDDFIEYLYYIIYEFTAPFDGGLLSPKTEVDLTFQPSGDVYLFDSAMPLASGTYHTGIGITNSLISSGDSDTINYSFTVSLTLDPESDADGDGMADSWEVIHFGDITTSNGLADADADGLNDLLEFIVDTDPNVVTTGDSDADGIDDVWEYQNFENLHQDDTTDFDGDSISDIEEFRLGTDPKVTSLHPAVLLIILSS